MLWTAVILAKTLDPLTILVGLSVGWFSRGGAVLALLTATAGIVLQLFLVNLGALLAMNLPPVGGFDFLAEIAAVGLWALLAFWVRLAFLRSA